MVGVPYNPLSATTAKTVSATDSVVTDSVSTPEVEFTGPLPEEREPNAGERATAFLARSITGIDDEAAKFATDIGASAEQITRLNNALDLASISSNHDPRTVQTVLADIVGTKTPAELLSAFEKTDPSLKPFLDIVRTDPALMDAIHNATSKDITVLGGLQKLTGDKSSLDPETLTNALQDPANRQLFTKLLEKVAEDPNLKFDDFAETVDAAVDLSIPENRGNKAKQERYMNSLLNFGLKDRRAELLNKYGSPIQALAQMWEDPNKFFDELAETLGGSPEQIEALKGMGEFFANFIGMYSNDPHIAAFMETYGPRMSSFGHALLSGKGPMTDTIIEIDPTKSFNTATTTPAPEAPAVATVEEPEVDAPKRTARIGSPEGTTLQMG